LAFLLLFFIGTVLAAQYHTDEKNGNTSLALGKAAAQKKTASQQSAKTSQRAADKAKDPQEKAQHQGLANGHTQQAATHKATAHGHFQQAVGHFEAYVFFNAFVRRAPC
jgi:hypothetical protein